MNRKDIFSLKYIQSIQIQSFIMMMMKNIKINNSLDRILTLFNLKVKTDS